MKQAESNEARKERLLHTLYALRGHFRESAPADPEDLTLGQKDAEGVILHCIDSRLNERKDLHLARGEYFQTASAGAAVPPYDGQRVSLEHQVDLGYPALHFPKVRNIVIMGHTHCGANKALYDALLGDAKPSDGFEAGWMLPVAPEGLSAALKKAKSAGVDEQEQLRIVEQLSVLQSMKHLYDYYFNDKSVRDNVGNGSLHVIGAIRDIHADAEGKFPLLVYDSGRNAFRKIEELYDEVFPDTGKRTAENIENAAKPLLEQQKKMLVPAAHMVVQKGAESSTVAEMEISQIQDGVRKLLDKVNKAGVSR